MARPGSAAGMRGRGMREAYSPTQLGDKLARVVSVCIMPARFVTGPATEGFYLGSGAMLARKLTIGLCHT